MKSIFTLLVLVLVALLSVQAQAKPSSKDQPICWRKAQSVVHAVKKFCSNKNIVVPGPYAGRGAAHPDRQGIKAFVKIAGPCKPAQKISQATCYKNFYKICRDVNGRGSGKRDFGKGKCQTWTISNGAGGSDL